MENPKIDKVIEIFRNHIYLKEDGAIVTSGNVVGTGEKSLGFNLEKDTPPVDLGKGRRRYWNPFFKDLAKVQKRNTKYSSK